MGMGDDAFMDKFDAVYDVCAYDFDLIVRGQVRSSIERFKSIIRLCDGLGVSKDDINSVFDFVVHENEYDGFNVANEVKWDFCDALDMDSFN